MTLCLLLREVVEVTAGLGLQVALALVKKAIHDQVSLFKVATDSQKRHSFIVANLAKGQVLAEPVADVHRAEVGSVKGESCVAVDSCKNDGYKDQIEAVVSEFTELLLESLTMMAKSKKLAKYIRA